MKKPRKSLILRLAVFSFFVYIAATLISQQLVIGREKTQLTSYQKKYEQQQASNAEVQRVLSESNDQYMESAARDKLGYAKPSERIYINVAGN